MPASLNVTHNHVSILFMLTKIKVSSILRFIKDYFLLFLLLLPSNKWKKSPKNKLLSLFIF